MLTTLFWLTSAAIVHHHLTYPLSLRLLPKRAAPEPQLQELPAVTILVPAYQEQSVIAEKIRNLADIDYPEALLTIEIHNDGSTDDTACIATRSIAACRPQLRITLVDHKQNRGKIATLNEAISNARTPIVVVTDASAQFAPDAIRKLCNHFGDDNIAAVGGIYECQVNGSGNESRYWRYQNALRLGESSLDSVIGLSGALYALRRDLFEPLPADSINDDFLVPMRMATKGKRVILDPDVEILEGERTSPGQEYSRRKRIGAGNFQQLIRSLALLDPRRPGLAYCFASGKALRVLMPALMVMAFVTNMFLAVGSTAYTVLFVLQLLVYVAALAAMLTPQDKRRTPFAQLSALVSGHAASGLGAISYVAGKQSGKWGKAAASVENGGFYSTPAVRFGKRLFDLTTGSLLFIVFAIVLIPVAVAIKLDSRGPVFYRQLRVGRQLPDRTDLFHLIKFRTMRTDAEAAGAAWATKGDPRVTRLGRFMRKTRIDELPQAMNVLRGEMSMMGPRPERPQFFAKLESSIPLYSERVFGVLPGITGLAQVRQGYDETIEDVRSKVGWDHAYAMKIETFWSWLKTDITIAADTAMVMIRGRGQ